MMLQEKAIAEMMKRCEQGRYTKEQVESYVNEAMEQILAYCNRETLPEGLLYTLCAMAMELADSGVKRLELGDAAVEYAQVLPLEKYADRLNRYRRMHHDA